ncbi:MAG TPA: hypothetical protein DCZ35_01995 [Acidimicrobiaceae bacterium]|nr:hypothetical protein [Acidimicrobiaceae bacterium]
MALAVAGPVVKLRSGSSAGPLTTLAVPPSSRTCQVFPSTTRYSMTRAMSAVASRSPAWVDAAASMASIQASVRGSTTISQPRSRSHPAPPRQGGDGYGPGFASLIGTAWLGRPGGAGRRGTREGDRMTEIGRGQKTYDYGLRRGRWLRLEGPEDVLDLMDTGADGIVAVVRDAGATFLGPIFDELAGVVCTGGTIRSHIGIVSREYRVPGVIAAQLTDEPVNGTEVELDASGDEGVIRLVTP